MDSEAGRAGGKTAGIVAERRAPSQQYSAINTQCCTIKRSVLCKICVVPAAKDPECKLQHAAHDVQVCCNIGTCVLLLPATSLRHWIPGGSDCAGGGGVCGICTQHLT